jgi:hypothetical protein
LGRFYLRLLNLHNYTMHSIEIFAELHWAVQQPTLKFVVNNQSVDSICTIQQRDNFVDQAVFRLDLQTLLPRNILKISMSDKSDNLITEQSDHWVDLKNIHIDQIPADQTMLINSRFNHAMSKAWCEQMQLQGYHIRDEYQPGTEIRLNGTCTFEFDYPFLFEKIVNEWKK